MKKKFMIGMVALTAALAFNTAYAGPVAAKSAREVIADYERKIKENAYGNGADGKGSYNSCWSWCPKVAEVQSRFVNDLRLEGGKSNALNSSLNMEPSRKAERVDALATIVAIKNSADNLAKIDAPEAQSLKSTADTLTNLLINSGLVGSSKSKLLSKEEAKEVTEVLHIIETRIADVLLNFKSNEQCLLESGP